MLFIDKNIAQNRYNLCKQCEYFNSTITTCKQCGCIMKIKVKLKDSNCPINKW